MIYALIAILVMQVIDGYSTYRILKNGGVELNPVQKFFIDKLGLVPAMLLTKLAVVVIAVWSFYQQSHTVYVLAVIYAVVVINNLYQWNKQSCKISS